MLKLFNKKKKDNKGFTLVELVIVVAILAILVGLLAPQYTKYVERSRQAADASNIDNLVTAVKVAAADDKYKDLVPADADNVFTFVISDAGSTVYLSTDVQDDTTTIGKALAEYAGKEWRNTTLKSSRWGTTNNLPTTPAVSAPDKATVYISATCAISKDGAVTVVYYPSKVKNSVKE